MSTESSLQSKIIKFLKSQNCYVIKTKPGPGVPDGCPDIIALCGGLWIAIEVKASEKTKFQPLQEITIEKLNNESWAKVVYPENWQEVKAELEMML